MLRAFWRVLKLRKNMRLLADGLSIEEAHALRDFSKWILDIRDGKFKGNDDNLFEIEITEDLLIIDADDPLNAIIREVYGESYVKENDTKFFQVRAILSPKNQDVEMINDYMFYQ